MRATEAREGPPLAEAAATEKAAEGEGSRRAREEKGTAGIRAGLVLPDSAAAAAAENPPEIASTECLQSWAKDS